MAGPAVEVEGLVEARAAFREAGGKTSDISRGHRKVAKVVEERARSYARSGTAQQSKAANVLAAKGTAKEAALAIRNTAARPFGIGAFMGAIRYRQFPAWVTNAWNIEAGEGPYQVAPAIRDALPEVLAAYDEEVASIFEEVGFDVTATKGI